MGTITLKEGGGCKDSSPEKKIGWIYTFESEMKPVMASKGCRSENVTAGDMFYRYSDRTEKMKLPEMSRIISERVTKELNRIRLLGSVIQDFIGKFFSEYSNNSYGPAVFFKPSVAEKTESLPLSTAIDERIPHSPGLMEPTVKCPDKFQPIRDPRFYFGNS